MWRWRTVDAVQELRGLVSVMWDDYWDEAPAKEKVVGETSTWVVENNIM